MTKNKLFIYSLCVTCFFESASARTISDLNDHLKYLAAREMILSQNLANIDTPEYKPKDLKKSSSPKENIGMKITHPGHIKTDQMIAYDTIQGDIIEIKPNGNAVTAEHELAKKNENAVNFAETSSIISVVNNMRKSALKSGG